MKANRRFAEAESVGIFMKPLVNLNINVLDCILSSFLHTNAELMLSLGEHGIF